MSRLLVLGKDCRGIDGLDAKKPPRNVAQGTTELQIRTKSEMDRDCGQELERYSRILLYATAAAGAAAAWISVASATGGTVAGSAGVPFVGMGAVPLVSAAVQSLLMWPGCPHL